MVRRPKSPISGTSSIWGEQMIRDYYDAAKTPFDQKRSARDRIICARLVLSGLQYNRSAAQVSQERQALDAALAHQRWTRRLRRALLGCLMVTCTASAVGLATVGVAAGDPQPAAPTQQEPKKEEPKKEEPAPKQPTKDAGNKHKGDESGSKPLWYELLTRFGKFVVDLKWPIVLGLFLYVFRDQLQVLLRSFERRGITLEVEKVKLTLADLATEAPAPSALSFSASPFDAAPDVQEMISAGALLSDIQPQITFPVTDTVARLWCASDQCKARKQSLEERLEALQNACRRSSEDLRQKVLDYCLALEACRFLESGKLFTLKQIYPNLRALLDDIVQREAPLSDDDRLVLHCFARSLAHCEAWSEAEKVLEKIALVNQQPAYLPAADVYLAVVYNGAIEGAEKAGDRWPDVAALLQRIEHLLNAFETAFKNARWDTFRISPENRTFYRRELLSVAGTILASIADLPTVDRVHLLERAEVYLNGCTETLTEKWVEAPKGGCAEAETDAARNTPTTKRVAVPISVEKIFEDPPTSRDFNNLADLYRQQRKFDLALKVLNNLPPGSVPDPTLDNTRAEILRDNERLPLLDSILALQAYTRIQAATAPCDDVVQYVRNEMLRAKLVYRSFKTTGARDIVAVIRILRSALDFLEDRRAPAQIPDEPYREARTQLTELLGYAYLERPSGVDEAEPLFATLDADPKGTKKEERWRRQVALARGHLAAGRIERRDLAPVRSLYYVERAKKILYPTVTSVDELPIDTAPTPWRRAERFRIHLDALIANVELALECIQQGDTAKAKALSEGPIGRLLNCLEASLEDADLQEPLRSDLPNIRLSLGRLTALADFILGQVLARSVEAGDVSGSLNEAVNHLLRAAALDPRLAARSDLEMGGALLRAAFFGQEQTAGQLVMWFDRGLSAVESAVRRGDAAMRTEALRVLASAQGQRAAVERRQKGSVRAGS